MNLVTEIRLHHLKVSGLPYIRQYGGHSRSISHIRANNLSARIIQRRFGNGRHPLWQQVSRSRGAGFGQSYPEHPEILKSRPSPSLLKPLAFVVTICLGSYYGAAYLTQRNEESLRDVLSHLKRMSSHESFERDIQGRLRDKAIPESIQQLYLTARRFWDFKRDSEKATIAIIAVNALVFLAWQIRRPNVQAFMARHFTHSSLSGRNYTLLTSVFSHQVRVPPLL